MGTNGADHHEGASAKGLAMIAMADSLCSCTFTSILVWGGASDKIITDMLNGLCGWNMKPEDYWTAAKRIMTAERVFQVRNGISSKNDDLPPRFRKEKLPEGPKKGAIFTDEDLKKMHDATYGFCGWDAKGIPTEATLKALNLEFLIPDVNAARKKYNL